MIIGRTKLNSSIGINHILIIVYVLVHLFIVIHHEAWRDESQAWIVARNCSVTEILSICASEGHPCLWFFILKACQAIGLSFNQLGLLSILIMSMAAVALIWKSPFSLLGKVSILISPIYFYYNAVISRVYCIVVLLVVLLCVWWPKRRSSPIIYGMLVAFLFQTHVLVAGFAMGCLLEMIICCKNQIRKKSIIGFAIPFVSLICMVLELRQNNKTETFIHINCEYIKSRLIENPITNMVGSVTRHFDCLGINIGLVLLLLSVVIILCQLGIYVLIKSIRDELGAITIVTVCGLASFWGIIILVRNASHIQMAIVMWVIMLFDVWTIVSVLKSMTNKGDSGNKRTLIKSLFELVLVVCCIISFPKTLYFDAIYDVNEPFSGSKEITDIIVNTVPEDSIIVLHNDMYSTSIAAYLYESNQHYTIWDVDNGHEFIIHKWGSDNCRTIDDTTLYQTICDDIAMSENCYYVLGTNSIYCDNNYPDEMSLITQNNDINRWNEYYQLYEVIIRR